MSLLGSFSRTTSPPATTKTALALAVMTVVCPPIPHPQLSLPLPLQFQHQHIHQTHRHAPCLQARRYIQTHAANPRARRSVPALSAPAPASAPPTAETIFLHAIARASLCRKHARLYSTNARPHPRALRLPENAAAAPPLLQRSARFSADHGKREPAQAMAVEIPKEELRDLVHMYDYEEQSQEYYHKQEPQQQQQQQQQQYHHNHHNHNRPGEDHHLLPSAALSPPIEEQPPLTTPFPPRPSRQPLPPSSDHHRDLIRQLKHLLKDPHTPHAILFETYQALPHPGVPYLPDHTIRKLMHSLSVVEFKTEQSMLRYLSLVDDMTAASIPMTLHEWNSAISFAGGWVRRVSDLQVETATQVWLRMEREAGVKSDNVTFNILFDIAAKAGKFALAEVIMKEMLARNMEENRYFRTSKIYYYGMKRDGTAVRRSYKELVDAGEFVDTAVLNCVIASLIRAGEASAGEHVFERMKRMHADKTGTKLPRAAWRGNRELGRVLNRAARILRKEPERRASIQDATPVAPDMHTYRLLIRYHAHESGNIDRVTELLDEMHELRINIHGSIFFQLFRGFHFHGGVRYSSWTKSRLDKLWTVFLEFVKRSEQANEGQTAVLDEEGRGCYFDSGLVIVVLQAYNKCADKDTTLEVWDSILERWKPEGEALEAVNGALASMFTFTRV
ncbi:hypothetical protein MBLNU459_g6286t1 [Dothideomycetes sp. NU459]